MQKLVEAGELTVEEAEVSERRNIILQALGPEPVVKVDLTTQQVRRGDTLILCSDGLSGQMRAEDIGRIVSVDGDLMRACKALIDSRTRTAGRQHHGRRGALRGSASRSRRTARAWATSRTRARPSGGSRSRWTRRASPRGRDHRADSRGPPKGSGPSQPRGSGGSAKGASSGPAAPGSASPPGASPSVAAQGSSSSPRSAAGGGTVPVEGRIPVAQLRLIFGTIAFVIGVAVLYSLFRK